MEVLEQISGSLQQGDGEQVLELTKKALSQSISPKEILDKGLISGMDVVGERFKNHELFLPEVLLAAKAFNTGMDQLKPLLIKEDIPNLGKIVIGTVQGDLHDIGKNLVAIMLKGAGFEVIDLGKDVPAEKFIETARGEQAEIIGMSALLTTTQPQMKTVIDLLKEQGLNAGIRTIVGGAPVSREFAREIGADAYAYNAASAIECVKQLVGVE